jgi:nitrate/TMAO reductase-like tetraheme cytochrome c subunit
MFEFGARIISRIYEAVKKRALTFLAGFVFAIFCFIGINAAMEPASKPGFCGSRCHEMRTAYRSWELSTHGANKIGFRAECVNCHLPSKEEQYFAHVFTKAYEGGKDVFIHYFIGGYDIEKAREKALKHMPNKRCMHCHDSLLTKPGSSAARKAHLAVLSRPEAKENRCVSCHEDAGHQRQRKLFSP